ncbi:MAG: chorismate synthase [Treponema sp.]|jgi:chorismate synthase|nr:chorismate synthase [Treponema sp.]
MASNTFGQLFRVTTFGESHGEALGCVIDGCPAGLEIHISDIEKELERRRPGAVHGSRDEQDKPEILSGIFEGKTLGTPIAIIVRNTNQNPADYDKLKDIYRPGHADSTWDAKFGFRDYRGGGRSSGRETLSRVAAGAIAKKLLSLHGIEIKADISEIAGIQDPEKIKIRLEELKTEGDSAGGIVNCIISGVNELSGLPIGLGEPVFDKLDARLAAAIISIGACKGIEFGAGFTAAGLLGGENNNDKNAGGILGGISNGQDIVFRAAFKPTSSIKKLQTAKDKNGKEVEVSVTGRHDVCIVPRAVPVVEAMTALVLADFLLLSRSSRL